MEFDKNESGAAPFGERVIIKHLPIDDTMGTGILTKPMSMLAREEALQVKSEIVALGELAFEECEFKPEVGDIVYTSKATGFAFVNSKGDEYRFINDKDIIGLCM